MYLFCLERSGKLQTISWGFNFSQDSIGMTNLLIIRYISFFGDLVSYLSYLCIDYALLGRMHDRITALELRFTEYH